MQGEKNTKDYAKYQCRFAKGSEQYQIFADFYKLLQLVYNFQDEDAYWDYLVKTVQMFYEKYQESEEKELAKSLGLWTVDYIEARYKEKKENEHGNNQIGEEE